METTAWPAALRSAPPSFLDIGFACCASGPSVVDLYTATNRLTLDLLLPHFHSRQNLLFTDLLYSSTRNDLPFLESVAQFLRRYFGLPSLAKTQLLTGGDLCFFYEQIVLSFCEPDEVVLLPANFPREHLPSFSRAVVQFVGADSLSEAPPPNARLLFLANPTVPFPDRNADLPVVVDESLSGGERAGGPFQSLATDPRIHGLFSFTPLLGLSGLHISVLYSQNAEVLDVVRETFGAWRNDSYCEWVCREIMSDAPLVDAVIASFRQLVRDAEQFVVAECAKADIAVTTFQAGVYVRLDLKAAADKEEERFRRLLEREKVFICPAVTAFGEERPGRCYLNVAIPREVLAEAIRKVFGAVIETFVR
jgi:aspartate/methionine/tyrosine aminotransferase